MKTFREKIIDDIESCISVESRTTKVEIIIDRREAIREALTDAHEGDIIIITGKGSETSMALAGGKKIPWSDAQTVIDFMQRR